MRHLPFGPSSTERMRPRRLRVLDLSPSTAYTLTRAARPPGLPYAPTLPSVSVPRA